MTVERGFKRDAFVGIESDSLSVEGDRAEGEEEVEREIVEGRANLIVYRAYEAAG